MTIPAARLRALVEPNRIHRNVYVDEEIFPNRNGENLGLRLDLHRS